MFILGVYSDQGPDNFDAVIDIANVRELYGISVCINRLFTYCKGGNFNIHIWALFG